MSKKGRAVSSIDAIEGMGLRDATRLRKAGVRTTEALLKKAGARRGRKELSVVSSVAERQLLEWVNRADLMRVKGIGSEYSDLLEAVGVDTVKELRNRSATALTRRMTEVNQVKKLVRRLPTEGMVDTWIADAKRLAPVVTH
jgi:predicted flap endonuclease-1-like 5' DNA nuclease